jgi:DNA-directed RNA polymerase specialized sigma subunit
MSRRRLLRRPMTRAQRAFACAHLGLAHQQAHRFARRWSLHSDDLLGPAYEGLCKGAIGYDASRGHRPSSYLVPKVKGELLHHLRDTGFSLRISHSLRELWIKARRSLALGLSDQQIAEHLQVPLERWLDCRRACGQRPLPLHDVLRD